MRNKNVFRMIKYFFRCKHSALYSCLMCVLGLVVGIVTPICNQMLQNDIIPNKNIRLFVVLTVVILVLNVVSILASIFNTKILINTGVPITSNMRNDIVKMNIFSEKNARRKGKVLISATQFMEDGNGFYISYMTLLYDCILKFMFYFPFFIVYGKKLALIMIIFCVMGLAFVEINANFAKKYIEKSRVADVEHYDYVLKLVREIKKPEYKEDEEFNYENLAMYAKGKEDAWVKYCMFANIYDDIFSFFFNIGLAICFCLAFNYLGTGVLTIGAFIVFNSYVEQLRSPFVNLSNYKMATDQYNATFGKIFEMMDDEELKIKKP